MLHFIYGKHGSGKTEYLITQKLSPAVRAQRSPLLIVPRQITFRTDETILDLLGPVESSEIEVFSFKRLCDSVMKSVCGLSKKPLKDGVNVVFMSEVLDALAGKLKVYNKKSGAVLLQKLLDQIRFFKTNCVSPDDLRLVRARSAEPLHNKLDDLILIYEMYNAVAGKEYYDENDLLTEIYSVMSREGFFKGRTVAFDGFSVFSVQQMRLIILAAATADDVYVTLCSDNIANRCADSPFAYVNNSARKLIGRASYELGAGFEYDLIDVSKEYPGRSVYNSESIRVLEASVFRKDLNLEGEPSGIVAFSAPTIDDECDFVAREIRKMLRAGSLRCRDIAVAFRSFDVYPSRLKNSFRKYGVPVFEDRRQPVRNSPLIVFVSALIELSSGRFSTDGIFKLLKTGLTSLSEEEISALENYCYMWNIKGAEFKREFTKNPLGLFEDKNERSDQLLDELNSIRNSFVPSLVSFANSVKNVSGRQFCENIYRFLVDNGINALLKDYALELDASGQKELALEQDKIWNALMEALDDIAEVSSDRVIEPSYMSELFELVISTKSLGKLPSHYDEVTLCSFDRLMNLTPKVLFSVGCNDGVFPSYSQSGGVFSEHERRQLLDYVFDFNVVEDDSDNIIYENFLVYHALTAASDKLFVTCAGMDAKGEKLYPSEVFSILERCFRGMSFKNDERTFENLVQSEASAFEYFLKKYRIDDEETASLAEFFASRPEYADRLKAVKALAARDSSLVKIEDDEIAKRLFGRNIKLSASRIESFEKCPFMYFCTYGLYAKERQKAEYDKRNVGSTVHEVLEKLLKKHSANIKEAFTKENYDSLLKEAVAILKDILDSKMGGEENNSSRFIYLFMRTLRILADTIRRLIFEFEDSSFTPVSFEKEIGGRSDVPGLTVTLDDGSVTIKGKIDRVDEYSNGETTYIKVVDYKTNEREFSLERALDGLDLQMIIYLISLMEHYEGESKPAGVLYDSVIGGMLSKDNAPSLKEFIDEAKQEGMLLDDDVSLKAVSGSGNDKVFPLKNKYLEEDFELISARAKKIIADIGTRLHNGDIAPRPAVSYNNDPCKYCAFASVCAKGEGVRARKLKNKKFNESLEALRKEAEE